MEENKNKVSEMLDDYSGLADLTSLEAATLFQRVGFDLIKQDGGHVDSIADAVGEALTDLLKQIDIPVLPEFIEVRLEALITAWVVSQIKAFGHARRQQ